MEGIGSREVENTVRSEKNSTQGAVFTEEDMVMPWGL